MYVGTSLSGHYWVRLLINVNVYVLLCCVVCHLHRLTTFLIFSNIHAQRELGTEVVCLVIETNQLLLC